MLVLSGILAIVALIALCVAVLIFIIDEDYDFVKPMEIAGIIAIVSITMAGIIIIMIGLF